MERLENDETHPLLPGVGHGVSETHVEFHIDCHSSFRLREPNLSARSPSGVRELIIYGQDEIVFKQNTYSSKCWVGSNGAASLLPKSDSLSIMVSGYESDKFGVGIRLCQKCSRLIWHNKKATTYLQRLFNRTFRNWSQQ